MDSNPFFENTRKLSRDFFRMSLGWAKRTSFQREPIQLPLTDDAGPLLRNEWDVFKEALLMRRYAVDWRESIEIDYVLEIQEDPEADRSYLVWSRPSPKNTGDRLPE